MPKPKKPNFLPSIRDKGTKEVKVAIHRAKTRRIKFMDHDDRNDEPPISFTNDLLEEAKRQELQMQGKNADLFERSPLKTYSGKMTGLSFSNAVQQHDKMILENGDTLRLLARNKLEIMNEVARADHKIEELKAKLAKKKNLLKNSRDFEDTLLLQADKLRFEKDKLSQRCENVVQEMRDRLKLKDKAISQVKAEIDNYIRLREEVRHRNEVLKERLEKREKIAIGLKTKVQMLSSWNVRSSSITDLHD